MNLKTFKIRAKAQNNPKKGQLKGKIQNFARALLGPITLLTAGGLFLGIGSIIEGQTPINSGGYFIGHIIAAIGSVVFNLLPLLFAVAIASAMTNNNGTAIMTSVVVYYAIIVFAGAQFVEMENNGGYSWFNVIDFPNGSSENRAGSVIENVLGVKTIQLNVFGGFIAGPVAVYCYRKFKEIRMPLVFSLFQGVRFVPIAGLFFALPISVLLALTWPWISQGFILFGEVTNQLPAGLDSFLYGAFERFLLPTGLHHMFYSPLLYTSAGALIAGTYTTNQVVNIGEVFFGPGTPLWALDAAPFLQQNTTDLMTNIKGVQPVDYEAAKAAGQVTGMGTSADPYLITDLSAFSASFNDLDNLTSLAGDRLVFQQLVGSQIQFEWLNNLQNGHSSYITRFVAGKVPSYLFFNTSACAAMYFAAPKENRKVALGVLGPAALTCALTGITEPFEYTYLFVAPLLYFGFQAVMTGLSFMVAQLAGIHFGGNDGGIIDLIIYGIIPDSVGQSTNWYWYFPIGLVGGAIFFVTFYFSILKWDIKTPGRFAKTDTNGQTKIILKEQKNKNQKVDPLLLKAQIMYYGLGQKENLENFTNCASRLRVSVKDPSLINYDLINMAKPFGIVGKNKKAEQFVFGNDIVIIAAQFKDIVTGKIKPELPSEMQQIVQINNKKK